MKIFISHSSREKWIALKILEDLEKLGLTVFLDEKNLNTGVHILDSIREGLNDCDDFLLLISPASLQSHWVLIELGQAIALQKNIVPILAFLGINEVPSPLNQCLARDLNDIDKYYSEIQLRLNGECKVSTLPEKQSDMQGIVSEMEVKCGERVTINLTKRPENRHDLGWNKAMDEFLGSTVTINLIPEIPKDTVRIIEDGGDWLWAKEWLIPVGNREDD